MKTEPKITQKFCKCCGGITVMKVDGKVVDPADFVKYGVVVDAGCIC